jgi:hypothetical protein
VDLVGGGSVHLNLHGEIRNFDTLDVGLTDQKSGTDILHRKVKVDATESE